MRRHTWSKYEMEKMPRTRGEAISLNERFFFTGKFCVSKHLLPRRSIDGKCIGCVRNRQKKRMQKYRGNIKDADILSNGKKKVAVKTHDLSRSIEMLLWTAAKNRARRKKMDFTIKVYDIKIPDFCPILGIKLDKTWGGVNQDNISRASKPSLDRIDSSKGYVTGNVIVVSYRANMIKGDGLPSEHRKIADFLKTHGL